MSDLPEFNTRVQVLSNEEVAVIQRCGADLDEKLTGLRSRFRDFVERKRVVDLARLAVDLADGYRLWHGDDLCRGKAVDAVR